MIEAGADMVAIDATPRRPHGYQAVASLIAEIQRRCPAMADVASLEDGRAAAEAGAALAATTLFGYTAETRGQLLPALDLVRALSRAIPIPVICEGGVQTPEQVTAVFEAGAYAVVVGTALTGIETRVREFAQRSPGFRQL